MAADESSNVYVVLAVDADSTIHPAVKAALPENCAFLGARTAEIALKLAARRGPSLAILSDTLPAPGYEDLINKLRALAPAMRIVMLTESRDPAERSRLVKLGPLLAKPLVPGRLEDAIASVLKLCKMSASVGHLKNESVNVQTWTSTSTITRGGTIR